MKNTRLKRNILKNSSVNWKKRETGCRIVLISVNRLTKCKLNSNPNCWIWKAKELKSSRTPRLKSWRRGVWLSDKRLRGHDGTFLIVGPKIRRRGMRREYHSLLAPKSDDEWWRCDTLHFRPNIRWRRMAITMFKYFFKITIFFNF